MPVDPQRVQAVFLAAADLTTGADRGALLDNLCGADAELRRRVETLLEAHEAPGSFLEPLAPLQVSTVDTPRATEGPGTLIGPYKLLEQIGEGGFGVVFMAEQTQPVRRKVALKVLKPGMDTRQVVARFEAERQALAIMDHPNIAKVLDGGATPSGRPYFVMDLVRGVPINEFCDQNNLASRQRLELFVTVCQAVQHAHQKGIIHRDLKPSNILVTMHDTTPVVKVIDFGVAKALGQELTNKTLFTGFAQMIGTPLYMSPEQAGQSGLDVDTRSDIYSLGVLLYELLTGTTPFDEERFKKATFDEIRRIIREEEPPKPSTRMSRMRSTERATRNPGPTTDPRSAFHVPSFHELDWIVMKALEKDRNRRYQSANSFAMDVRRFLNDEPVQACPPSAIYRFRKFARRNKAALIAVGLLATVLVVATAVSSSQAIRATNAEWLAEKRLVAEKSERARAVEAERQARVRLFEARVAQARASRLSRQAGQRFESWQVLIEAAQLARELGLGEDRLRELRDEAIACLAQTDVQLAKEWDWNSHGSSSGLAFDADLQWYARTDRAGTISVHRVDDYRELVSLPGGGVGAANICFSPDGPLLAIQSWKLLPDQPTNFQLWDWQRKRCVFEPSFPVHAMAFSPDGRYLALGHNTKTLTIYDTVTRNEERMPLDFTPANVTFHPAGSKIAVASSGGDIQVREVSTGNILRKLPARSSVWQFAWHPDGVLLAAGCADSHLYLWDMVTGQEHAVLRGHQAGVVRVAFSPDGETLLSSAWDGSSRLWDSWTGRELVRFPGEARHFSRDGRRLAGVVGTKLAVWDVAMSREYRSLPKSQPTAKEGIGG
ncbi:MAG: serine/threonine-protein kinase, partial [Planctomycetia bacterium]|nr:serine/threonine-protein kinase [Planctomycetia bacterium]